MQAAVATLCTPPAVGMEARATKNQKRLYAAQCTRLKALFAASECRKASEVVTILANLPPGSVFQVVAASRGNIVARPLRSRAVVGSPTP